MMTTVNVKVQKLSDQFKLFADDVFTDTWGSNVVINDVYDRIKNQEFETTPYSSMIAQGQKKYDHAARIAYLVQHHDETPISIDVGCPSLAYYNVCIEDGNHRLAAAIVRGDKTIKVNYAGEVAYFCHLFIRRNKKYS